MTSLFFVTPAFKRFPLSSVCFQQRRLVMDELEELGIEARCVVVADDENVDIAKGLGFDTVEQDNEWLGRRFNDGIEYAGQHGATWIVPIGSDSWIDPAYFLPLPDPAVTRTSGLYCPVTMDRLAECRVPGWGAGPIMFHRDMLEPSGFRPAQDRIKFGCDTSTVNGVTESAGTIQWEQHDVQPFQYLGFRAKPSITPYEKLRRKYATREHRNPWPLLAEHYPPALVEEVRRVLVEAGPVRRSDYLRRDRVRRERVSAAVSA
jgi:hypothetical protein